MAINDFLATIWSETLYKALDKEYVAVKNCNREFEGEIKTLGDRVKVLGIDPINVFTYTKNTDFSATLQTLDSNVRTMYIDQTKAFNFQIDDIDRAQQNPKLMKFAMQEAANALANQADAYVFSLHQSVANDRIITKTSVKSQNIIDILLELREKMLSDNVSASANSVLEVSPAVAAKIAKAKILQSTNNTAELDKGFVGSLLGFDIYVSNNIDSEIVSTKKYFKCFARTRRAIAFAEQINDVEAYRPEKRFADAVKGLHLYGAKIIYPNEVLILDINVAADA
ncbi:MAG: hypothetical protein FWF15_10540 [Oscillospiraceae bacterium]|nr:hypothetical protein [Oscillospiraceae bacterium]